MAMTRKKSVSRIKDGGRRREGSKKEEDLSVIKREVEDYQRRALVRHYTEGDAMQRYQRSLDASRGRLYSAGFITVKKTGMIGDAPLFTFEYRQIHYPPIGGYRSHEAFIKAARATVKKDYNTAAVFSSSFQRGQDRSGAESWDYTTRVTIIAGGKEDDDT